MKVKIDLQKVLEHCVEKGIQEWMDNPLNDDSYLDTFQKEKLKQHIVTELIDYLKEDK